MRKTRRKSRAFVWVTLILLVVLGDFMATGGYQTFLKMIYPLEYQEIVEREAENNGVDKALVYAVIKAESNFDASAKSHAGALGLMQITPPTFEWLQTKLVSDIELTEEDLLDPEINIRYGCRMLAILTNMYSELKTAICAYNAGIGRVNGWLEDSNVSSDGTVLDRVPFAETDKYSTAVLKNYEKYKELYQWN